MSPISLLEIKNLNVSYKISKKHKARVLQDISLSIENNEKIGIIGESGCGKTTLINTILQLLPENGTIDSGAMSFDGQDLLKLSNEEMRKIRGKEIAIVPQNAMNALDPVFTIGTQLMESILAHVRLKKTDARQKCMELLKMVGLSPNRFYEYPHQLSGGTKQRICLAIAFALNPKIVIADEPTTGLDVVLQDHILNEIENLCRSFSATLVIVSHDISVIAEICDRVVVMYGGRIMEFGPIKSVLFEGANPYTMGLRNAFPSLYEPKKAISIPGSPPDLTQSMNGCVFRERCPFQEEICIKQEPKLRRIDDNWASACHFEGFSEQKMIDLFSGKQG